MIFTFSSDAIGGHAMLDTAENVARKYQISTSQQHDVVLRRFEQYGNALKDDRAFPKRYMTLPFPVPKHNFKGEDAVMEGDEGIFETSREGLARLKPVREGGSVTFGGQTQLADGSVGLVVTSTARAGELSPDTGIRIRLSGCGQGRTDMALMPEAPVVASRNALRHVGVEIDQIKAINSHNPFAVNDIVFARETGADLDAMNNYGCSPVWGHPQGPTGLRAVVELIEELVIDGGGLGLFQGCAAGDSSMAVVVEVADR